MKLERVEEVWIMGFTDGGSYGNRQEGRNRRKRRGRRRREASEEGQIYRERIAL